MRISHNNVTEVLHVLGDPSSFVANKMKCVFVKSTSECLQVKFTGWQFTMKFILKFTIEVYNECFVRDEVLTQSYKERSYYSFHDISFSPSHGLREDLC